MMITPDMKSDPTIGEMVIDRTGSTKLWDGVNWVRVTQSPSEWKLVEDEVSDESLRQLDHLTSGIDELQRTENLITANNLADKLIMEVLSITNINPLVDAEVARDFLSKIDEVRSRHNNTVTPE